MHSSQKLKWGCIRCPTISVDLCFSQMIFRHHRAYWWKLSSCIFYPNSLRIYVSLGELALRGLRLLRCNLFWISRPPQHDGLALWVLMLAFWLPIPLIRIDIPCPWCCVQRHSLLALAARDESGNWSVLPFPAICVTPSRILSRGVLLLPLMAGDFQYLRFVSLKFYRLLFTLIDLRHLTGLEHILAYSAKLTLSSCIEVYWPFRLTPYYLLVSSPWWVCDISVGLLVLLDQSEQPSYQNHLVLAADTPYGTWTRNNPSYVWNSTS